MFAIPTLPDSLPALGDVTSMQSMNSTIIGNPKEIGILDSGSALAIIAFVACIVVRILYFTFLGRGRDIRAKWHAQQQVGYDCVISTGAEPPENSDTMMYSALTSLSDVALDVEEGNTGQERDLEQILDFALDLEEENIGQVQGLEQSLREAVADRARNGTVIVGLTRGEGVEVDLIRMELDSIDRPFAVIFGPKLVE